MLARGTVKAIAALVLLVFRLRRWDILQTVTTKVGIHFDHAARAAPKLEAVTTKEKSWKWHKTFTFAQVVDGKLWCER